MNLGAQRLFMSKQDRSYTIMARRAVDLFEIDPFILVESFTPGGRGSSAVGFVELSIAVAKELELTEDHTGEVTLTISGCPVHRKDGKVHVSLPELKGGGSILMSDRYSEEQLQEAFRSECSLLVKAYPELKPLLGDAMEAA